MSQYEPADILSRSLSSSSSNYEGEGEEAEELSEADKEARAHTALFYELEQTPEIAARFTEGDPEFAEESSTELPPPPLITQWVGPRNFGGNHRGRGGRGGGGHHYDDRKRNQDFQDRDRDYNRRDNRDRRDRDGYGNQQQYDPSKRFKS